MTTGQVRGRIAAAAGIARTPPRNSSTGPAPGRGTGPLVVLIDALDEAADPAELASGLLRPLIEQRPGSLRLLLGTRRTC